MSDSAIAGFADYARELKSQDTFRRVGLLALRRVDSTNSLGRRILTACAGRRELRPTPLVVTAWEQTRGRGRRGKAWASPAGRGVYASALLDLPGREALATLPLLAPQAVCRVLGRRAGAPCRIKWPNDLVVGGRKIAGLLLESVVQGGDAAAVVGFGVNVAGPAPVAGATTLEQEGRLPPRLAVLTAELVEALLAEMEHLGDPAYAVARYEELAVHRPGDPLSWRTADGSFSGTFNGFDRRGFLRVTVDGVERRVSAAELVEH